MGDISKLNVGGTLYDIKDAKARTDVSDLKEDLEQAIEDFAVPTQEAVDNWLDEHPEATTTVEDHSITYEKLVNGTLGFVTPQMFGAVGDGVSDDTTAFFSCFSGMYNNIYIPYGTYLLSNSVTIKDGTTVSCDGIVTKSGSFDVLFNIGSNCDIQINIDLNQASATDVSSQNSVDIKLVSESGTRIHDTKIINTDSRYAIWIEKCSNIIIENCIVDKYVYTAIGCRDGNENVKIINNTVLNGHGIQTNRYPICLNSSAGGLGVSRNVVCSGNYIEDVVPTWEAIDAHDLIDAVISNNTIVNTATGIAVVYEEQVSQNITITGNTYRCTAAFSVNASSYGITVATKGGSSNIILANNTMTGCGNNSGTTDRGGIKVYGIDGAVISNNTIECVSGEGIHVQSYDGRQMNEFLISNNIIRGADNGIQLTNGNAINITGKVNNNVFDSCGVGLLGMTNNGNGYDNCVYAVDNEYVDCATNYNNVIHGLLISPSSMTNSNFGRKGMVIEFDAPQSYGYNKIMCVSSGDANNAAVWSKYYKYIPICGEYTLDNGYVNVWDSRITADSFAVVTNHYETASSPNQIVTAYPQNGRMIVYVHNNDGTNATGKVKLALLIIQTHE